jgi:hypothetical protein
MVAVVVVSWHDIQAGDTWLCHTALMQQTKLFTIVAEVHEFFNVIELLHEFGID